MGDRRSRTANSGPKGMEKMFSRYKIVESAGSFVVTDAPDAPPGGTRYWKEHPTLEGAAEDAAMLVEEELARLEDDD